MKEVNLSRRHFVKASVLTAVASSAVPLVNIGVSGANEKFVVGVIGAKGRGLRLARYLGERSNVQIAWICDVDSRLFKKAVTEVEKSQKKPPKTTMDFRHILDDKNIDAVFNATPDHWHAIPTIMACQAGKDVYVEKPVAHNIWEGQKMVEAARTYNRIVQVGTQSRSAPYIQEAIDLIRSGKIGDVHLVRVFNMKKRKVINFKQDEPVPEGVNYDMWLGPAPDRPFNPNHFHYNWHWFWNYSGGDIINDSVHQIDLARWIVGQDVPKSAYAIGGKYSFEDAQETPDTQSVLYEFNKVTITFELTLWTPYMKKIDIKIRNSDLLPHWPTCATRVEVYGTNGFIMLGRQGGGYQIFDQDGHVIASQYGRRPTPRHLDDFFDCIRSRKTPHADIEKGHKSTLLCHLGNISYRMGGKKVSFDTGVGKFVKDSDADTFIKRTYRKPWIVPDKV